jgi:hypothetical protein
MWLLYILFTFICCFITFKITCYQVIKLYQNNQKIIDIHQNYIEKSIDQIASIKTDVIKIKKDIYQ